MTDWGDPLVIAALGLVAVTGGLIVATSVYASYTKKLSPHTSRRVELLERPKQKSLEESGAACERILEWRL